MTHPSQVAPKLWIFGYGSLIWNPGFPVVQRQIARLTGYHRSFCMRSIHHRGTIDDPGLVLALDAQEGATCDGVAFGVEPSQEEATLIYLRERELISSAYFEQVLPIALRDGREVEAVTFVIDPKHDQYVRDLDLAAQAEIIAKAIGGRGPNTDYLYSTAEHLTELGIEDRDLDWLANHVRGLTR